jgi:hypothetical protein
MMTSNYATCGRVKLAVSIAGGAPEWYTGRQYKKLAPKLDFFLKYKQDGDESYYTEQFKRRVLGVLDPNKVWEELGEDSILLCWESPGEFCHRRIVAEWFQNELGVIVPEYRKV